MVFPTQKSISTREGLKIEEGTTNTSCLPTLTCCACRLAMRLILEPARLLHPIHKQTVLPNAYNALVQYKLPYLCSICVLGSSTVSCIIRRNFLWQGSPCVLPTTAPLSYLDMQGLAALLEHSGHDNLVSLETWSRDAGVYYCNEQFYRTLHAIRVAARMLDGFSMIPVSCELGRKQNVHFPSGGAVLHGR